MGAPILIDNCSDLWVSNSTKDCFCEVVVAVGKMEGIDASKVFQDAPGVAGTFGVSGMFVDANEFFPYFGGRQKFRTHLEVCIKRLPEVRVEELENQGGFRDMHYVIEQVIQMLDMGIDAKDN